MELYNYENVGFLTKYSKHLYLGCLALTAIVFLVLFVVALKKRGFFKKIFWLLIAGAATVALFVGSGLLRNYTSAANAIYNDYKRAYKEEKVSIVSGRVEGFGVATHSKSFTVDGVQFTVYSTKHEKFARSMTPILHYVYTEDGYSYSGTADQWLYKPEQCVILGNNQNLEIHYIEEDGEKRILYIKEISE